MPLTTDEKLLTLSREVLKGFDKVDGGIHPGFRPAHAKGILLAGLFTPSSEASSLTTAPHINRHSTPVTVRFSDFAGIPTVPDNDPQNAGPRGCAIRFHLAEHVHTDIVAHSVDTFPAHCGGVSGLPQRVDCHRSGGRIRMPSSSFWVHIPRP
jgi:catalase